MWVKPWFQGALPLAQTAVPVTLPRLPELERTVLTTFYARALEFSLRLVAGLVIVYVGIRLVRLVSGGVHRLLQRSRASEDATLVAFGERVVRYVALAFVWMTALGVVGVEIGPIVASLGITGFILGFAFKDALSNFAAGLLVMLYRPFKLGDRVEVSGLVGAVQEINVVATVVRTDDGRKVFMPNSRVWGNAIVNHSAYTLRRMEVPFIVDPALDMHEVLARAQALLEAEPLLSTALPREVRVLDLAPEGPRVALIGWVEPLELWQVTDRLKRQIEPMQYKPPAPPAAEGAAGEPGGESTGTPLPEGAPPGTGRS